MKTKTIIIAILFFSFIGVGCLRGQSTSERIIGTWSGLQTAADGTKVPATWAFFDDGTMVINVAIFTYGATWSIDGDRLDFVTEAAPERPTYRIIEFVSDDVMKLTKPEADIEETWGRQ